MDLDRITAWKGRFSMAGALLCCLFALSVIDGSADYILQPVNSIRLLPGESTGLTGPMAPGAGGVEAMCFETGSPAVSVSLDDVISGAWLGTKMWRGKILLSPETVPGKYSVSIFGKEDQKRIRANSFHLTVYKDRESYLAASGSLVLRYSGVSPWAVAGSLFILILPACACLYVISGKKDLLMAGKGEAEVFHVKKDETGISIYFGLGRIHGIGKGSELLLLDPKGLPMGKVIVESVSDTDALAKTGPSSGVRPGCFVKRMDRPAISD